MADYLMGTFLLALSCVAVGELTLTILRRTNQGHIANLEKKLGDLHERSVACKRAGDEIRYRRLNRSANDTFGRLFFNRFTLSAASLWFVFIALAWMQTRFMKIEFPLPFRMPLLGRSVGYVFIFLLMYVLARILVGNIKRFCTSAA